MASMTITITEDADPDGNVYVDFDLEGFDIDSVTHDAQLPPAAMLGAAMVRLGDEIAMPKEVKRV